MQLESTHAVFGREVLLATALSLACMISACGGLKQKVADPRDAVDKTRATQAAPPPQVSPPVQTALAAPSAPPPRAEAAAPFAVGTLSVRSDCKSRDQTGYTESIKLAVEQGRVDMLEARIDIPRRGSCGFRLADFRQTHTKPHVELQSIAGTKCTVRMWRQGERFTVAFSECHEKCTRGAFDYVWPVELNAADGSCL